MGVIRRIIEFDLALANAGVYAANDQLGGINEIANAAQNTGGTFEIESIVVVDRAKQMTAIDFLFFQSSPTLVSADNGEFEISDAELAAKFLGFGRVTDYAETKESAAGFANFGRIFLKAPASSKSVYCVAVNRDDGRTFADGDITVKIGVIQGGS